jgi:hypothetical protein
MGDWLLLAGQGEARHPTGDTYPKTARLAQQARELMHELNNDL